jgi:pimeloyl-ACP methyl ester carboxylesterase
MNTVDQSGQHTGLPSRSRLRIAVRGKEVAVAASSNDGDPGELVLLLHGLGCDRSSFDAIYTGSREQARRRWIAIDFPGHGDSPPVTPGLDLLGLYADLVAALVEQLAPRTVHIVGHSMGAAVATIAAPALPLGTLISIEGNLTGEDCELVSRQIASQEPEAFTHLGFALLRDEFLESDQTDRRIWGSWLTRADPQTVWAAAKSLVAWCDAGGLAARWPHLEHTTYLWGERSGYPRHLHMLLAAGDIHRITGAAHFPMIDNPIALAAAITDAIDQYEPGDQTR